MKRVPVKFSLVLFSLVAVFASDALAQAGSAVGQVSTLTGQANVIRTASTPLTVGEGIFRTDVLVTLSESFLEINLNDGSTLSLDEDSRLEVSEFVTDPNPSSLLKLARGKLRTRVSTTFSKRRESFKVQTREGTMGVQGTEFDVLAEPRETLIYVYEGLVSAASRDPRYPESVTLGPGDWIRIRLGEPLPPPGRFIVEGTASLGPDSGGIYCLVSEYCSQPGDPTTATPLPPHGLGPPIPPRPNPPGRK